jgi:eukaryotic-like serine/threonine-protein kinase
VRPEHWQQLKGLFHQALELAPGERTAFLDQACAEDESLRQEIDALLASHESAAPFLDQPAYETAAELIAPDDAELNPGAKVGPYTVSKKLGQGGMGVVYLAIDSRLGRRVAMKALAPRYTGNSDYRARLKREARIAATLSHPSIATIYALEEYEGDLYIISEYVQGPTLHEELTAGPMPVDVLLDTAVAAVLALATAHEQGIVHRDLKPENLIRTPEGGVKILDFGLARFQNAAPMGSLPSVQLTRSGMFVGTPAYSSPEQLLGKQLDFHTDIFSFGVMLYEMATGTHPFSAGDSVATIARILEAEPVDAASLRPILPPALDGVVRRCLRKKPEERYHSARDLAADLGKIRRELSAAAPAANAAQSFDEAPPLRDRKRQLWWWQFHQVWIGFTYYGMLYPMWQVKVWTPHAWGPVIFFTFLAAVGLTANLRFYLWFASIFYPEELPELRCRVSRWIRWGDITFVGLLLAASLVIITEHEIIATLLIGVAIATLGAFLLIEPITTRAAFRPIRD